MHRAGRPDSHKSHNGSRQGYGNSYKSQDAIHKGRNGHQNYGGYKAMKATNLSWKKSSYRP